MIKALFETKKIEQILEEAKDSVKYYQGNTFKLTYFQDVHPSLIKRHWEYPDRMRGEVYEYCLKNVSRYNSIYYAGIGLIGRKNTEFWINFQNFVNSPFPKFESFDEKWGLSIGFSSPLWFKK